MKSQDFYRNGKVENYEKCYLQSVTLNNSQVSKPSTGSYK